MTVIEIDRVYAADGVTQIGVMTVDADEQGLTGSRNPTGKPDPVTMTDYLVWLGGDLARRMQAGWMAPSKYPGELIPTTRWGRLVMASHSLPADHPLRMANLT